MKIKFKVLAEVLFLFMGCTDTPESIREEMTEAVVQEPNANDMDKTFYHNRTSRKAAETKTSLQHNPATKQCNTIASQT